MGEMVKSQWNSDIVMQGVTENLGSGGSYWDVLQHMVDVSSFKNLNKAAEILGAEMNVYSTEASLFLTPPTDAFFGIYRIYVVGQALQNIGRKPVQPSSCFTAV